eukprot:SAG11_NODE_252_length_11593_cov_7.436663_7_plen_130_part_00
MKCHAALHNMDNIIQPHEHDANALKRVTLSHRVWASDWIGQRFDSVSWKALSMAAGGARGRRHVAAVEGGEHRCRCAVCKFAHITSCKHRKKPPPIGGQADVSIANSGSGDDDEVKCQRYSGHECSVVH